MMKHLHKTTLIQDVMQKDVACLDKHKTVLDAATLMVDKGVGSIVVLDDNKPAGMVTKRDILCEIAGLEKLFEKLLVGVIASRPLVSTTPDETISNAANSMLKNNIRRLVVLKNGKMDGIVTLKDIAVFILENNSE